MMIKHLLPVKNILFTALCIALVYQPAEAKTMYKWVDKDGKIFFSDQVPPSKAELKHEELDKNAQVVKVHERAKTKAELEIEKRLMLLRKQQEQIIINQKAHDKKLLSNFITVQAMDATYKNKVLAMDGEERDINENIKSLEQDLTSQQQEAASYEIKNSKVPPKVIAGITETQKKLALVQKELKDLQIKKATSKKEYEADRTRYLSLTKATAGNITTAVASIANTEGAVINQPGLFNCNDALQCEKAWPIAKEFVKANSLLKITVDTDTLIMSEDPIANIDLGISASKIAGDASNKPQIFLDIRCTDTNQGKALCASAKADEIRNRFNDYIKTQLNAAPAAAAVTKPATPPTAAPQKR